MPYQPKKLDLEMCRSFAIDAFVGMQTRRLPGMKRDLTNDERVTLAQLRGAVQLLNRLGVLDRGWLDVNTKDDS